MARSILLADDSVTIRRIVDLAFRDTGILVDAVGNGADAIDRLRSSRPDVVLADVSMPTPDGYDVCREVKASSHPVPVLLLRGAFDPFDAERAETCGADGTLTKPFEADRLVERVRRLIERENGEGPPSAGEAPCDDVADPVDELVGEERARPRSPAPASPPVPAAAAVPAVEGVPEAPREVPVHFGTSAPAPAAPDPHGGPEVAAGLSDEQIDILVDRIVRRMTDRVVREIAWEVVPDLASAMIRQRLREIESGDAPDSD